MKRILLFLLFLIVFKVNAQFTGESGVYFLGSANQPISSSIFSNPDLSGVVVRFKWGDIETAAGIFNWNFIDAEIAKAVSNNKKVSLQPLDIPIWLKNSSAKKYYYIDSNSYHSTYGQVVSNILTWDTVYISRYKIFLQQLAAKYASDTSISYINTIGGAFSRGLPDSVLIDTVLKTKQAFWTAFNYNADSLGKLMNQMTDFYMALFPSTHLWCSVDYVIFEPNASGNSRNYLAGIYTNYGLLHYPDRFGLWREDIAGCNPPANINSGSHWYILQQNPCRTGAQMLWSVQDGPARMNKCGILPNTKTVVLDSAVNKGLKLGMRYLEIYAADIIDVSLSNSIQQANNLLIAKGQYCNSTALFPENKKENLFTVFPNPSNDFLTVKIASSENKKDMEFQIFNLLGNAIKESQLNDAEQIDVSDLDCGIYFIRFKNITQKPLKFIKN